MPVSEIARTFRDAFPESRSGPRTVGREAEYPVVGPDGEAADVRQLWLALHEAPGPALDASREGDLVVSLWCEDYTYALEVGWGTVEIITGPHRDLHGLKAAHEAAVARLYRAAESLDYRVLGFGTQPLSPPSAALMSPKLRYRALHEALGDDWYWFTVTASDQVHVDIDRRELVDQINLVNLMTPVVVALCGNSPVVGGAFSGAICAREAHMGAIHAEDARHGMPLGPIADMQDLVDRIADQPYLVHKQGEDWSVINQSFRQWLAAFEGFDEDVWKSWLMHEHYTWSSGRPRSRIATIELRSACQQPHASHMAAAALGLGVVEAAPQLAAFLRESLGERPWPVMRAWHGEVVREGLAAPEPAPGLIAGCLARCRAALEARGFGEEGFVDLLDARLAAGKNPGQEALEVFRAGGVDALIERAAL